MSSSLTCAKLSPPANSTHGFATATFGPIIAVRQFAQRRAFLDSGLFDAEVPAWQDLDLFIRILQAGGPAKLLDAELYVTNIEPRTDRISVGARTRLLAAFRRLAAKWSECPQVMLQGLYLQRFGRLYRYKPTIGNLIEIFRFGLHLRTLKSLAGVYLRCF